MSRPSWRIWLKVFTVGLVVYVAVVSGAVLLLSDAWWVLIPAAIVSLILSAWAEGIYTKRLRARGRL